MRHVRELFSFHIYFSFYCISVIFKQDDNIEDNYIKEKSSTSSSLYSFLSIIETKTMPSFIPSIRRSMPLIPKQRLHYIWSVVIIIIALLLYNIGTLPYYHLPKALTKNNEIQNSNEQLKFIGEYAYENLHEFVKIGPKVVGSPHNEQITIKYLIDRIILIQNELKNNNENYQYEIDIDVQVATGNYIIWNMINMYQGIQNVVVKLSPVNKTNDLAILVNSHFDSVPGSPGKIKEKNIILFYFI